MAMFDLSIEELQGQKVLDCPAGSCSFTAIGCQKGLDVTACDIAYYHPTDALAGKGKKDIKHVAEGMKKAEQDYVFHYFRDIDDLIRHRKRALDECTASMKTEPERYIPVELPVLSFEDDEFDLILSAHFLFTYGDRLDLSFHLDVIEELLRVARKEIRFFPLVDLSGNRYEHLDKIISGLREKGYRVEEIAVPYEFQKNANAMMKIQKSKIKIDLKQR
nr:SAM-dependent methyltransferase [Domibacillus robiginosus]